MKITVVPLVGTAVFFIGFFTNALAIRAKKGGTQKNEVESF
jgi:hypothetical protein